MNVAEPFVDIHCHMLPGIDDGAADLDEALRMAEMAVADGVGVVVTTPHQLGGFANNQGPLIRARVADFQRALQQHGIPLTVLPGGDVRIEPELVAKVRTGAVVSLADRRRHLLLELPHEVYTPLDRLLVELRAAGIVGVLSHPERNLGILGQPAVLHHLIERGCLMQITAGSLLGVFGTRVRRFAEWLVKQELVHFVASDAHGTGARSPLLRGAYERVAELAGEEMAATVFCHNPACVTQAAEVRPVRGLIQKTTWTARLCRIVQGAISPTVESTSCSR